MYIWQKSEEHVLILSRLFSWLTNSEDLSFPKAKWIHPRNNCYFPCTKMGCLYRIKRLSFSSVAWILGFSRHFMRINLVKLPMLWICLLTKLLSSLHIKQSAPYYCEIVNFSSCSDIQNEWWLTSMKVVLILKEIFLPCLIITNQKSL